MWVAATSRHSDCAAALPLRMNRSMRRLYLICPKTGSIVILRLRVELAAAVGAAACRASARRAPSSQPRRLPVAHRSRRAGRAPRSRARRSLASGGCASSRRQRAPPRAARSRRALRAARSVASSIGSSCPKSGGVDRDLRGEDDLPLVDRGLRVVGLPGRGALGAHHPRVRVGQVDLALRQLRRRRTACCCPSAPDPSCRAPSRASAHRPRRRPARPGGSAPAARAPRTADPRDRAGSAAPSRARCASSSRRATRGHSRRPPRRSTGRPSTSASRSISSSSGSRCSSIAPALALRQPPLRVRQRLPAALRGAQLLGQLITATPRRRARPRAGRSPRPRAGSAVTSSR